MFWTYLFSGCATVLVFVSLLAVGIATRNIERLTLVRQKPVGAAWSQAREFLRIRHGGHNMAFGKGELPRELPVDKFHPYLILGKELPNGERGGCGSKGGS